MKSVRLDEALESRLEEAARATGRSVSQIIRDALRRHCEELLSNRTLFMTVHPHVGSAGLVVAHEDGGQRGCGPGFRPDPGHSGRGRIKHSLGQGPALHDFGLVDRSLVGRGHARRLQHVAYHVTRVGQECPAHSGLGPASRKLSEAGRVLLTCITTLSRM